MEIGVPSSVGSRRAFTLIELLIVIAVMALLMGLAIPAFQGITRGSGMQSGLMQLRTTISLARQWAISHRTDTYVVFPDADANLYSGQYASHRSKALRAFAVYSPVDGYISEWTFLPNGIVFDPLADTSGGDNVFNRSSSATFFPVAFPTQARAISMCAIAFRPDGRLKQEGATIVNVYLKEGVVESNLNVTARSAGASAYLRVFPLTGQMKAVRP